MKCILFVLICAVCAQFSVQAQDYPLLTDHPGSYKLIDWGVYTHWDCGFTKAETTANYQKIIGITDLVRLNPDYWNRKLPRSAIQFMWMEIPPKEIVKRKMDDRWKRQDGYYYVSRLLYELDVKDLIPIIEK